MFTFLLGPVDTMLGKKERWLTLPCWRQVGASSVPLGPADIREGSGEAQGQLPPFPTTSLCLTDAGWGEGSAAYWFLLQYGRRKKDINSPTSSYFILLVPGEARGSPPPLNLLWGFRGQGGKRSKCPLALLYAAWSSFLSSCGCRASAPHWAHWHQGWENTE